MGYGADEHWEEAINECRFDDFGCDSYQRRLDKRFNDNIWTLRDGSTIAMTAMKTSHLRNAIGHIQRSPTGGCYGYGRQWLPKLNAELKRRATQPEGSE